MPTSSKSNSSIGKFIAVLLLIAATIILANWFTPKITLPGFGGIAGILPDTYLVVHDWKDSEQKLDGVMHKNLDRFGVLAINAKGRPSYTPITSLILGNHNLPSDLESLCTLSNEYDAHTHRSTIEVLSAESGHYHDKPADPNSPYLKGEMYQINFTINHGDLSQSKGTVLKVYALPQHTPSTGKPELHGGNFEGLVCASNPKDQNEVFVLIGERGGEKKQGANPAINFRGNLRVAILDLKRDAMGEWNKLAGNNEWDVYDPPGTKGFWTNRLEKRDISALDICGNAVWALATQDEEKDNKSNFKSILYHVAEFVPDEVPPFRIVDDRSFAREIEDHKVEGLWGTLTKAGDCTFVAVTDDEDRGGAFLRIP